jgi:hypothetical protein
MKNSVFILLMLMATSLSAKAFQQEFLDPSEVRTPHRLKDFRTITSGDENIFPVNKDLTEREYIETSGYRIQLISTQDRTEALEIKKQADERYDLPVYIDFEPPNYKVRIGNYSSNEEAMRVQETLRRHGFKFAWVVPSKIIISK